MRAMGEPWRSVGLGVGEEHGKTRDDDDRTVQSGRRASQMDRYKVRG